MIYNKIKNILIYYLERDNSKEEYDIENLTVYNILFDTFKDELFYELDEKKFEALDQIYMLFDSYEENEDIRKFEPYCIDETMLIKRINEVFKSALDS